MLIEIDSAPIAIIAGSLCRFFRFPNVAKNYRLAGQVPVTFRRHSFDDAFVDGRVNLLVKTRPQNLADIARVNIVALFVHRTLLLKIETKFVRFPDALLWLASAAFFFGGWPYSGVRCDGTCKRVFVGNSENECVLDGIYRNGVRLTPIQIGRNGDARPRKWVAQTPESRRGRKQIPYHSRAPDRWR